jgi:hypothetical protein
MSTTEKRYLIVRSWAGRCTYDGSDKVWAGALVKEDGEAARSGEEDLAPIWHFLAAYGKTGSNLNGGDLSSLPTPRRAAEKLFESKVKEKAGPHHYVEIAFAPFAASFKVPLVLSPAAGEGDTASVSNAPAPSRQRAPFRYPACKVVPFSWERCLACLASPLYGWTEKMNGERCLVEFDGGEVLAAYNRLGNPMSEPPTAANHLRGLGRSFVVDGERLLSEQAGGYTLFDLLEWEGEDVRHWPYLRRIQTLQRAMYDAGLLAGPLVTPSNESALANSTAPGLVLLISQPGGDEHAQQLVELLRQQGREGVVVRQFEGAYSATRAAQKFKFLAELDAVVIGFEPGSSEGSVRLGLVRPSDGAVIEIGNMRAGLSDGDIRVLRNMRADGQWPVLTVEYLPIRTVGVTLVEARTSLARLRTDKRAQDCTTDQFREQFGPEKDALIRYAEGLDLVLS